MLTKYLFKYLFIVSLAGLGLFLSLSSPAKAEAPIGNWRLDETSGSSFEDSAGPDNDGTCTNCPTPTTDGKVNGTQKFDGTNDTITVPPNSAYDWNNAQSFSVEIWVKGTAGQTCAGGDEIIVGRVDDSAAFLWSLGCTNGSGLAQFRLKSLTLQSTSPITDGQWHHLVGIRDTASGTSRLYVDGTEVASSTTGISGDFIASQPVTIGALNGGAYFEGLIDEVTLHDVALTDFEVNSHYYLASGNTEAQMCASPLAIMPLGDSITEGNSSGVEDNDYKISYRKDLWERLVANGHRIAFTGTLTHGIAYASEGFSYHHEGHGGWSDSQVADNIYDSGEDWLTQNPSNVVLLHIGTNAPSPDPSDVEKILDKIDQFEADYNIDVTVVLALIINKVPNNSTFSAFNANIKAMAEARIANDGDKIIIVDMENDAGLIYKNKDDGGDFWDSLHPWETGYTKMANLWYAALETFVPACDNLVLHINSIPPTTVTVNQLYSYDVQTVDGNGVDVSGVSYSLIQKPSGMTINTSTGLIEWTPTQHGSEPVTVQASAGGGSVTQTFTITVADIPPEAPQLVSTAVTSAKRDELYQYDVNASGYPAPAYTLTTAPTGMTIVTSTGEISWTPDAVGSYDVSVHIANSVGSINHSFSIDVTSDACLVAGAMSYWRLNETSSPTSFADEYELNDGTCSLPAHGVNACPTPVSGRLAGGQSFNGSNQAIGVADHDSLDWQVSDSFSIELWVNTTQDCSGNKVFIGKHGSNASWWVGCTDSSGEVIFSMRDSDKNKHTLRSTSVNDGQWHHIVAVRDGTANKNQLYVDGQLKKEETTSNYIATNTFTNDAPLTIAVYDNKYRYTGMLDEVALYNQLLSPTDISEHYSNGSNDLEYCIASDSGDPSDPGDPGSNKVYLPFVIK